MNKISYFGIAKAGKVELSDATRDDIKLFLLANDGAGVEVTVEKFYDRHSDRQRRFYFGPFIESQINCFKERYGKILTKDQQHTFNKGNYFCEEFPDHNTGEIVKIPGSTKRYNTVEFETVLERIRQSYFEAFDWQLPFPNED